MKSPFNHEDNIDDIFRRELKDHRVATPKGIWSNINSRLQVRKNPLPGYIAAATVIGAFMLAGWWGVSQNNAKPSKGVIATTNNSIVNKVGLTNTATSSKHTPLQTITATIADKKKQTIALLAGNSTTPVAALTSQIQPSSEAIAMNYSSSDFVNEPTADVETLPTGSQTQFTALLLMAPKPAIALSASQLNDINYNDAILSSPPKEIATLSNKSIRGFYAGANTSITNVWILDRVALHETNFNYSITSGYTYGLQGGYNFSDNFGLEAGLTINARDGQNYTLNINNVTPENKSVVLNYTEIPIIAKFKIPQIASFTGMPLVLNINVGASYGYLRYARTFEDGDRTGSRDQYPNNQLNVLAGFNYDIYTHHPYSFSFGFMAEYGVNTVDNGGSQNSATAAALPLSQYANGSDFNMPHNLTLGLTVAVNYNFSLFH